VFSAALIVYAVGVVIGLIRVDGSAAARLIVAFLWPVGLAAAAVTIGALVLAAMVLFPMVGVAGVVPAVAVWWIVR
jgi:hypothetical protein